MKRLHNLDYLRGLAACSIMIFHYSGPADTGILGRIGLYGVSIFYILSGLTLYLVYKERLELRKFFIKRIFRIFPLLWLAIIGTIIISQNLPEPRILALNASGLFGFIEPTAYIGMGMWSIGNELVFYALFPVLMMINRGWFIGIVSSLFILYLCFAFVWLDTSKDLVYNWATYINPLNQAFLFVIGILIGHYQKNVSGWILLFLFFVSASLFVFIPVTSSTGLVTGYNRLYFTGIAAAVCFVFYKTRVEVFSFLHASLKLLGEASYSIYLLHPLVLSALSILLSKAGWQLNKPALITLAVGVTIFSSWIVYQYFEKYFVRMGSRVVRVRRVSEKAGVPV